jgi:hypothetical protein
MVEAQRHPGGGAVTTRRWLPVMVRARQAREDSAARELATARREAERAVEAEHAHSLRVAAMNPVGAMGGRAFLAAAAVRHAAAATHAASRHRVVFADQRTQNSIVAVTAAARERRTMEKLAERQAAEEQAAELAAAQHDLDDLTVTRFGWNARQGNDEAARHERSERSREEQENR